jgi:DNA repair protein RecN (Recombination protein N)
MLCELRVKNLALIESLELRFEQAGGGLVVLTGETGAGKSIMLRAIHLLSGRRASVDWIRSGESSCEVEALFEINPDHRGLLAKLENGGFGADNSLVIKRVVSLSGRSRFYVNGCLATGKIVADLSVELLSVASQHDHQQLLQPSLHLAFLDTIGDIWPLRLQLQEVYGRWQECSEQLAEMKKREQEKEQRQDFLKFQVAEIRSIAPEPGEDERLLGEKKRLKNSQTLIELSQTCYKLLSSELGDGLSKLRQHITQLAVIDPEAARLSEEISGYTFLAEDYVSQLRAYRESIETDPFRLDQINERLDQLSQLKRKFGETIAQVLQFVKTTEEELRQLANMEKEIAAMAKEVQELQRQSCGLAGRLSEKRRKTAACFEQTMVSELASLAFDQPGFAVCWQDLDCTPENLRASGWDRLEFYFTANPGEEPKPLAKIASGGELSRLMLALKCILARKDMVETVIFDEVDAGIGGEAAEAVARKIQELSGHHQVFCITHLPQIAARGSLHFKVEKTVENGRTQTRMGQLSSDKRVGELVRMLAGDSATGQTEAWARELLVVGAREAEA